MHYSVQLPSDSYISDNNGEPDEINFADFVLMQPQSQRKAPHHFALDSYLTAGTTYDRDTLRFWHEHKSVYPGLKQMARDALAVPVSGAGVERYISAARLI